MQRPASAANDTNKRPSDEAIKHKAIFLSFPKSRKRQNTIQNVNVSAMATPKIGALSANLPMKIEPRKFVKRKVRQLFIAKGVF